MKKLYGCIFILLFFLSGITFGQTLTILAKTESYGGTHAPLSAAVIWIQTPDGEYIATPQAWGLNTSYMLKTWRDVTGLGEFGWFDGVTAATRQDHDTTLVVTWDCKNSSGTVVEQGAYEFWVEMSESDFYWKVGDIYHGKSTKGTIQLDPENDTDPVIVEGTTVPEISQITAKYYPKGSGINFHNQGNTLGEGITFQSNNVSGQITIHLGRFTPYGGFLRIYNTAGSLIKSISCIPHTPSVFWNRRDETGCPVASGVYFVEARFQNVNNKYPVFSVSLF